MKKIFLFISGFLFICLNLNSQICKLNGTFDAAKHILKIQWNMVNSYAKTGYILIKSEDGISWKELSRDRMIRNYTEDDLYFFDERNIGTGKTFYRIRIMDNNNNTVVLSNILVTNTMNAAGNIKNNVPDKRIVATNKETVYSPVIENRVHQWAIYPNPVNDELTINYKGSDILKGVINVIVHDMSGKTVIKFRAASTSKTIQIPVNNLRRGVYLIELTVMNELQMNERFVKQ